MAHPYQRTPAQIALALERKTKQKLLPNPLERAANSESDGQILPRPWIQLLEPAKDSNRFKVLTWNLLAQCLVRRKLFPTSNCLKAGQREAMIHTEILSQKADIICLQEVDRLEKLTPVLADAGYSHQFAAGPGKQHGLLIAYKSAVYRASAHKMVQYDEQEIRTSGSDQARLGRSFLTKNIANLVALESINPGSKGVIVATTHLFWHPRYTYERCRQAAILFRETKRFRQESSMENCSCIIAGDFNFPPDDPAYSLLAGATSIPEDVLESTRVVHCSIDPTVPVVAKEAEDEGERSPPSITNAREATTEDGLLSTPEFIAMFSENVSATRSAYDTGISSHKELTKHLRTFGDRVEEFPTTRRGAHEPEWTSYTHFWKSVLDYIFLIDPIEETPLRVTGLLEPHKTDDIRAGLPQHPICGSDHVSLCVELE